MPVRNLLIICVAAIASYICYDRADRNRYASTLVEAMHIVQSEYIEDVGQRDLFDNAMSGMVKGLDPYSSYISISDYQPFLEGLDQEFGGVGIVVELNPDTNRLTVLSPLYDTPAYNAGIKAGDTIISIDGQDTEGLPLKESVKLMRGPPGTTISISVLHAGDDQPVPLTVERAIIPIESVLGDSRNENGTWDYALQEDPRITYVRLTTFGEHTVDELSKALNSREVKALILDLRDNAGGLLSASVGVCDMFVDEGRMFDNEGTIVSTRGRDGRLFSPYNATAKLEIPKSVPMVVLINNYSASASEIVAACLQDHKRAKIIGQRSWGKGTVQNIIPLEGGRSALKLTTASYWRPSQKNIHRKKDATDDDQWGVTPDEGFAVELTPEDADKVRIARRSKDAFRETAPPDTSDPDTSDTVPDDSDTSDTVPDDSEPATDELFDDPQLRKGIEYLQRQLSGDAVDIEPQSTEG